MVLSLEENSNFRKSNTNPPPFVEGGFFVSKINDRNAPATLNQVRTQILKNMKYI